jgi:hypothetical protein
MESGSGTGRATNPAPQDLVVSQRGLKLKLGLRRRKYSQSFTSNFENVCRSGTALLDSIIRRIWLEMREEKKRVDRAGGHQRHREQEVHGSPEVRADSSNRLFHSASLIGGLFSRHAVCFCESGLRQRRRRVRRFADSRAGKRSQSFTSIFEIVCWSGKWLARNDHPKNSSLKAVCCWPESGTKSRQAAI